MFTQIMELKTHYQKIGKGPILILLHGWGCDWQIWSPVIAELSDKFTLIIPDLPAFGKSEDPSQPWDSFQYLQWLNSFISEVCKNRKYSLAGHSFGGKLAALHAAGNPDKLQKLVIIDASGLPVPLTGKEQVTRLVSKLVPQFIKSYLTTAVKSKLLSKVGVATDYQHANKIQQGILKKIVRENIADELVKINKPTLIIWGENDEATPIEKGKEFAALIKDSQLSIFNHSDHFPFIRESEKFTELLKKELQ